MQIVTNDIIKQLAARLAAAAGVPVKVGRQLAKGQIVELSSNGEFKYIGPDDTAGNYAYLRALGPDRYAEGRTQYGCEAPRNVRQSWRLVAMWHCGDGATVTAFFDSILLGLNKRFDGDFYKVDKVQFIVNSTNTDYATTYTEETLQELKNLDYNLQIQLVYIDFELNYNLSVCPPPKIKIC